MKREQNRTEQNRRVNKLFVNQDEFQCILFSSILMEVICNQRSVILRKIRVIRNICRKRNI